METPQKRDRDRKKLQKRNVKEARRKERSERRRAGLDPIEVAKPIAAVETPADPGLAPREGVLR